MVEVLVEVREAERRSVPVLAEMAGVRPAEVRKLEQGRGPVSTLLAVLEALQFQVAGIGSGRTLADQLRLKREKRGMTLDDLADRAALSRSEVADLEAGEGSMQNLLSVLGVLAPKIRRRAPERAYWGKGDKEDRDARFTPAIFMEPVYATFGKPSVDPCGNALSPVEADRRFLLEEGDDGLRDDWFGALAWVNPPYSEQQTWLRRAHGQWSAGNVETVLVLVPTRTDSAFFHDTVVREADIFFIRNRIKFLDSTGRSQATPHSLMLVAWGATARQKAEFAERVQGFWLNGCTCRSGGR